MLQEPTHYTDVLGIFRDPRIDVGSPSVNPVARELPHNMIKTRVPTIDAFNCLVKSQKIRIFQLPASRSISC